MSFTLDIDDDFDVFDNTEEVQLTLAGTNVTFEVCALRRQVSVREAAASGGAYTARDVNFSVPRKSVCKTPPGVGSLLVTQDQEYFTIVGVDVASFKSRYRCYCRAPVLASELSELLTIEEPTYLRDRTNAPYESWTPAYANVLGKVYESESQDVIVNEDRQKVPHVMIYLKGQYDIQPNFRIRDSKGNLYLIHRVTTARLGGLMSLEATSARMPASM